MKDNPKRFKYGRVFRCKLKKFEVSNKNLNTNFLIYGIKAVENGKLTKVHLQSVFRLLKKLYKKNINIKFNIALTIPVSRKHKESRMGKGKGPREYWECSIKKGLIILEIGGLPLNRLKRGFSLLREKLPINTKVVRLFF